MQMSLDIWLIFTDQKYFLKLIDYDLLLQKIKFFLSAMILYLVEFIIRNFFFSLSFCHVIFKKSLIIILIKIFIQDMKRKQ